MTINVIGSENTAATVNGEAEVANSTVDKMEAEPATENGEKAIEKKKPEAASDTATRSDETTSAEAEKTETCSAGELKTETDDKEAGDGDKV